MYEVFKIKYSKPIPKIFQKPLWFWKTPNFAKIPKTLVSKNEMHENEGLETYQVRKNSIKLEKCLRKRFKGERRVFGRWIAIDKSRKWSLDQQESIYRTSVNLDRLRCREVSSWVSSFKSFDRCIYWEVSRCP